MFFIKSGKNIGKRDKNECGDRGPGMPSGENAGRGKVCVESQVEVTGLTPGSWRIGDQTQEPAEEQKARKTRLIQTINQ